MESTVIGVIVRLELSDIDLAKLDWGYGFNQPVKNLSIDDFRYFVTCVGDQVKFVAKVSKAFVLPNDDKKPWHVEFSEICEVTSTRMDLGHRFDKQVLINKEHEEELRLIIARDSTKSRPAQVPLHLSIKEAEAALRVRYGLIDEGRVEISLHN
jgi:hypothetical protein